MVKEEERRKGFGTKEAILDIWLLDVSDPLSCCIIVFMRKAILWKLDRAARFVVLASKIEIFFKVHIYLPLNLHKVILCINRWWLIINCLLGRVMIVYPAS